MLFLFLLQKHLSTLLCLCQYAVIIKLTTLFGHAPVRTKVFKYEVHGEQTLNTKKGGNIIMKYPTKLSDAVHIMAFIALHPGVNLTSEKIAHWNHDRNNIVFSIEENLQERTLARIWRSMNDYVLFAHYQQVTDALCW